jgi:sigma-E factor negative regulatory protein RseB
MLTLTLEPLPRRMLLRAALVVGWQALPLATVEAAAIPPPATASRELMAWLMRIHAAASRQSFQGTFVVSTDGVVSSARIAHFCVGANQFERIESLDGQARRVLRHNDRVYTVWPATRSVLIEERNLIASFPAVLQAGEAQIDDFYEMRVGETGRVAGRDADQLIVSPRDALRFGYRLWADKATALLLRVEVVGDKAEVLESSAFSDVTIGIAPHPDRVLQAMKQIDGFRVLKPVLTPTRFDAEGWSMRLAVPGFDLVSCVKRPLDGLPGDDRDPEIEVLQAIFADGLTYVSLFIEPYHPERHHRDMLTSIGATHTLMRRHGQWWVTAVGDVPGATLRRFDSALEYNRK